VFKTIFFWFVELFVNPRLPNAKKKKKKWMGDRLGEKKQDDC
jgi:hypothetical protein